MSKLWYKLRKKFGRFVLALGESLLIFGGFVLAFIALPVIKFHAWRRKKND